MAKRKANGGPQPFRAYTFREKDPEIMRLRDMAEQYYGKRITGKEISDINKEGGPSASCMRAWWQGDTKRPRNDTLEAAGRAMGFERVWKKMRRNSGDDR